MNNVIIFALCLADLIFCVIIDEIYNLFYRFIIYGLSE